MQPSEKATAGASVCARCRGAAEQQQEEAAGGPELVGGLLAAAQEEVFRLRTANMLLAEAAARCTSVSPC